MRYVGASHHLSDIESDCGRCSASTAVSGVTVPREVGRPERTGPLTVWDLLDDDVVAGPAVEHVEAGSAIEHIVAGAPEQRVVARTAL